MESTPLYFAMAPIIPVKNGISQSSHQSSTGGIKNKPDPEHRRMPGFLPAGDAFAPDAYRVKNQCEYDGRNRDDEVDGHIFSPVI